MKTMGIMIAAVILLLIAGLALVSQLSNRFPVFIHWRGTGGMAIPTAFCFVVTGVALIVVALEIERK